MNLIPSLLACNSWEEIDSLIQSQKNTTLKGNIFSDLVKCYFLIAPEYLSFIRNVWSLTDVPNDILKLLSIGRRDKGIDLIARTHNGEFWAIQCKYLENKNTSLTRSGFSTFTDHAYVKSGEFSKCILCTTGSITGETKKFYGEKVLFIANATWQNLQKDFFDNIRNLHKDSIVQYVPLEPREDQKDAVEKIFEAFINQGNTRGQLIYPCGSGKSLIGFLAAKKVDAKKIIVLAPSLSLISQLISTWTREAAAYSIPIDYQVVCSDSTVNDRAIDSFQDDSQSFKGITTDQIELQKTFTKFQEADSGRRLFVFATYQSAKVLSQVALRTDFQFDLGIFDEAHRTSGAKAKAFALLLSDEALKIKHRLFMTATPRVYVGAREDIASMEDEVMYGKVIHSISFQNAIDLNILSDYKLVTIEINTHEIKEKILNNNNLIIEGKNREAQMIASAIALSKVQVEHNLKKTISFHGNISRAKQFITLVQDLGLNNIPDDRVLLHVSSHGSVSQRDNIISEFKTAERSLLTNARCLSEGIDIPSVDSILFADPKKSKIDIVQCIGRALRKSPGKDKGYIIVPVLIENGDLKGKQKAYGEILSIILQALAASDDRIFDFLKEVVSGSENNRKLAWNENIQFLGNDGVDIDQYELFNSISLKLWSKIKGLNVTIGNIITWIKNYHIKHGHYPKESSGFIEEMPHVTWEHVSDWLKRGCYGLPKGSSLPRLLSKHFNVRNIQELPDLDIPQILAWIEEHRSLTGEWPNQRSGLLLNNSGETWAGIDTCLQKGRRGLIGSQSIKQLIAEEFGERNKSRLEKLSIPQILVWAEDWFKAYGRHPTAKGGLIPNSGGETWSGVASALHIGGRGLSVGKTLNQLVSEHFGIRSREHLPDLSEEQIVLWMKNWQEVTGSWPKVTNGIIPNSSGETWSAIQNALQKGRRGMQKGQSISTLLSKHFNVRDEKRLSALSIEKIKEWALSHYESIGSWPTTTSGLIPNSDGETWGGIDIRLRQGGRGLPGGSKLSILLAEHFSVRNRENKTRFTELEILEWLEKWYVQHGSYPTSISGSIPGTEGLTWATIEKALKQGRYGLPKGYTLARFKKEKIEGSVNA